LRLVFKFLKIFKEDLLRILYLPVCAWFTAYCGQWTYSQ